ncbi:MAG: HDIG domain-containing protein [Chloroflexi bacterium]|nr:HDIG domain-containing protein [Chloroflexota bacterium]
MTEAPLSTLERTTANAGGNGGFLSRWSRDPARWRRRLNLGLFSLAMVVSLSAALLLVWPQDSNLQLQEGQINPVDVRAPRPTTYQSEVLTIREQDRAAAGVQPIYDPPQTRVARQQLDRAQAAIDFVELVRNDLYASEIQQLEQLTSITHVFLSEEMAATISQLSDARWEIVANEIVRVLDRVMRQEVREDNVQAARRSISGLISFGLSDDEAAIANAVVRDHVVPNTLLNSERTDAARAEASASVAPVERNIAAGETIIRGGDRVDALDMEAMEELGLLRSETTWREFLSASILSILLTVLLIIYVTYRRAHFWEENLQVFLLGGIFIAFIILAKLTTPIPSVLPYLYPLAAMAMLLGALIELPIATVATMIMGVLVAVLTSGDVEVVSYVVLGALGGALALGRAERLNSFVKAGLWVIVTNLVVLAAFQLPLLTESDGSSLLALTSSAVVNGIFASSFTLVVFYLLGQVFGLTTSLQLLELSRPTQPLLRQLLLKAPGTYHHTLIVSNMAEEAASAIGADILLTRVGGYYHDIGKTVRPYFFIENNSDGVNPHDRLDPYTSGRIIISHVTDGVDLAQKHRLPSAIIDFIREHHGTTRVEYFYYQACQEHESEDAVDESKFRYPGPRPRSRETALLMLADGCEATVRSMSPATQEETLELIRSVIDRRLISGQLDDCQLTLRDLSLVSESFARVLQGIHHPRVKYPGDIAVNTKTSSRPANSKSAQAVPTS